MVRHFPGALAAPVCQEKAEGALSSSQFPPPCISVVEPCRILCGVKDVQDSSQAAVVAPVPSADS